ncbi:hypothetical protein DMB66_35745 [Actinoplanes sp. ATCC 53533]|uniref:hypothetical protein n=1 Tax=Actinoplanes sp. ATCC 53533 TaxID=1288362 RepID=UPI000F7AE80C|nr:hypothetical protein [Actinoplanes sp. ATCC 53533]RSM55664.1 hypothetical protein DMB66_35745 [Actinoplanes sp. ATCC 53533]
MSAGTEAPPSAPESTTQHLVRRTGVVADVLGVAGGVAAFIKGDFDLFALSIVAVMLISASWFWRRRTSTAVGLLVTGCVLVGCVATLAVNRWLHPQPAGATAAGAPQRGPVTAGTAQPPAGIATQAATGSSGSGSTVADGDAPQPVVVVDQTVTLERGAAADVDAPDKPPAQNRADGATGEYDLYHDWGAVKSDTVQPINGPNAYTYPGGNPGNAYSTCKEVLATATPYMSTTGAFCFRTSAGRIGYAVTTRERSDHAFVLHVVVWNDPA